MSCPPNPMSHCPLKRLRVSEADVLLQKQRLENLIGKQNSDSNSNQQTNFKFKPKCSSQQQQNEQYYIDNDNPGPDPDPTADDSDYLSIPDDSEFLPKGVYSLDDIPDYISRSNVPIYNPELTNNNYYHKTLSESNSGPSVLILGDGDLSFGASAIDHMRGSTNIDSQSQSKLVATVYESSEEEFLQKYDNGKENLDRLTSRNIPVLFGVDATNLCGTLPDWIQQDYKFDIIVFNFPFPVGQAYKQREQQVGNNDNSLKKSSVTTMKNNLVGDFLKSVYEYSTSTVGNQKNQDVEVHLSLVNCQWRNWNLPKKIRYNGPWYLAQVRPFISQHFDYYQCRFGDDREFMKDSKNENVTKTNGDPDNNETGCVDNNAVQTESDQKQANNDKYVGKNSRTYILKKIPESELTKFDEQLQQDQTDKLNYLDDIDLSHLPIPEVNVETNLPLNSLSDLDLMEKIIKRREYNKFLEQEKQVQKRKRKEENQRMQEECRNAKRQKKEENIRKQNQIMVQKRIQKMENIRQHEEAKRRKILQKEENVKNAQSQWQQKFNGPPQTENQYVGDNNNHVLNESYDSVTVNQNDNTSKQTSTNSNDLQQSREYLQSLKEQLKELDPVAQGPERCNIKKLIKEQNIIIEKLVQGTGKKGQRSQLKGQNLNNNGTVQNQTVTQVNYDSAVTETSSHEVVNQNDTINLRNPFHVSEGADQSHTIDSNAAVSSVAKTQSNPLFTQSVTVSRKDQKCLKNLNNNMIKSTNQNFSNLLPPPHHLSQNTTTNHNGGIQNQNRIRNPLFSSKTVTVNTTVTSSSHNPLKRLFPVTQIPPGGQTNRNPLFSTSSGPSGTTTNSKFKLLNTRGRVTTSSSEMKKQN